MTPALTPELRARLPPRAARPTFRTESCSTPTARCSPAPRTLADPARDLLSAAPEAESVEVAAAGGTVFAARSGDHAIALVCGRHALPALARHDLDPVLDDLAADRDAA